MCFARDADAAVGVFVTTVGVDALRSVRAPKELVLASLPMLFGIHQITVQRAPTGASFTVLS